MTPRTGRELPSDLRDYRAPEGDGFQIIAEDLALAMLAVLAIFCLVFWPEFQK